MFKSLAVLVGTLCASSAYATEAAKNTYEHAQSLRSELLSLTKASRFAKLHDLFADMSDTLIQARNPLHWNTDIQDSSTYCSNQAPFDFFPFTAANLTKAYPGGLGNGTVTVNMSGTCFQTITATVAYNGTGALVTVTGANPTGLLCSDAFMASTSFRFSMPIEISPLSSTASTGFAVWNTGEQLEAVVRGLRLTMLPCGILGTLSSAVNTITLFNANETIATQPNLDFLEARGVWPSPLTPFNKVITVDKSNIKSGDVLAVMRMDGLDPMISWATGKGATGHTTIAVWRTVETERKLYVCESTDSFGAVVEPFGSGIVAHEWDTWMQLAAEAGLHVSILPLNTTLAAAFDEDNYWAYFTSVEGQPYGYHNMLFSVLDTADPIRSLPLPIDNDAWTPLVSYLDKFLGNGTSGPTINSLFTQALNKRMGTNCVSFACILYQFNHNLQSGQFPTNYGEATSIPENDQWIYSGNYSRVCSAFVSSSLQAGLKSVFPTYAATEQTPIDVFRAAIYDPNRFTATNCPGGFATPLEGNGNVCQVMGAVIMPLNGFNTLPIYNNMNQACGSQWPNYQRCLDGSTTCQC